MINKLYISCAGSGKTTILVKKALQCKDSVLICTFTQENEQEIRKKVLEQNGGLIPGNLTIKTWFSFLLEHGAKPYQGKITKKRINGLQLVNSESGIKYTNKNGYKVRFSEQEVDFYYFNKNYEIYSDKLSKFVIECNKLSGNYVIERISSIFSNIFIDEVQDLAGYDLEIIKLLFMSKSNIFLAGDPRQVTYHTHFSRKHKKYNEGKIEDFIKKECRNIPYEIDLTTLSASWRNNQEICEYANLIFPEHTPSESKRNIITIHTGVYLIKEEDVEKYLETYKPLQLRINRERKVNLRYSVKNYGASKGLTVPRVLIYPTKTILNWCVDFNDSKFTFDLRCKFYVAITRAQHSVGIVCPNDFVSEKMKFYKI